MLTKKEVYISYLISLVLFFLSGSKIITGWHATICGIIGTMELATALLHYSPLHEALIPWHQKVRPNQITFIHKPGVPVFEGHKLK